MKIFILRLTVFLLVLLLVEVSISSCSSYYEGNPWYKAKIEFLHADTPPLNLDLVIFGSSRMYRQFDPRVFDSTWYELQSKKIRSFNLGAPATFCPQTYHLFESFLESPDSDSLKTVIIELLEVDMISESLMHEERTIYYQNPREVVFALNAIWSREDMSFQNKIGPTSRYLISGLENLINIGQYGKELLRRDSTSEFFVGPARDGFLSLDEDMASNPDQLVRLNQEQRMNNLEKDIEVIERRALESEHTDLGFESCSLPECHRVQELIDKADEKNIQLIFLLPPRNVSPHLIQIFQSIPHQHRIDLSSSITYPQFYAIQNSFDIGHLNEKGSELFTIEIANKLASLYNN